MANVSDPRPIGLQGPVVFREVAIVADANIGSVPTAPTISSGSGEPSATRPQGSLYVRTDAGAAGALYANTDGAAQWDEIPAITAHEDRVIFHDDLHGKADTEADHRWILNSGLDAQALDPAIDTAQPQGVWQLVTGNADGTAANDGSQMVWADLPIQLDGAGGEVTLEARVRIKTAISDVSVFIGLTDATGLEEPFSNSADTITSTATDGAGFLYDSDSTTADWWGVAVDSDSDDTGNATTGQAPVADTWQVLKMVVSNDGATVQFYVDGSLELTLSGAAGCGDDVVLYPTLFACSTTTTSKTVDVDYCRVTVVR